MPVVRRSRASSTPRHAVRIITMRATHRNQRRPPNRLGRFLAIAVALVLGAGAAGVAVFGLAATATVAYLSEDLPDPSQLESLTFAQPTILYDRDGEVELGVPDRRAAGRRLRRRAAAGSRRDDHRGGPHVLGEPRIRPAGDPVRDRRERKRRKRARGIDDHSAAGPRTDAPRRRGGARSDRYIRKAKEILQSMRLNETYPGVAGKERVVTAYLNEIYYGHKAYGIAAAAQAYFGVEDLAKLTPAQAALLASLPKSPSTSIRILRRGKRGWGPGCAPLIRRRSSGGTGSNLSTSRWTKLTPAELKDGPRRARRPGGRPAGARFRAGHFTGRWSDSSSRSWRRSRPHHRRLPRHHDARLAGAAGAALGHRRGHRTEPQAERRERLLKQLEIPSGERGGWIRRCAARTSTTPRSSRSTTGRATCSPTPAAPGTSAISPRSGSNRSTTPATASGSRARREADPLRGRVRGEGDHRRDPAARHHDAVQRPGAMGAARRRSPRPGARSWSAKRSSSRSTSRPSGPSNGSEARQSPSARRRSGSRSRAVRRHISCAGLAGALGTVEVRPLDLTSAYGTFANGGVHVPPRMILEVRGPDGSIVWKAPSPRARRRCRARPHS